MKKKEQLISNRVGMFDFAKGMGMICIIFAHTISYYNYDTGIGVFNWCHRLFSYGLMAMFFIISGYGFRPQKISKTIRQQTRYLLLPYIKVTLSVLIIFPCIHYLFFKWWPGAIHEMMREVVAFCFGVSGPSGIKVLTWELYDCGSMWYILSLYLSWIILNMICQVKNEKMKYILIVFLVGCGFVLARKHFFVMCLSPALISVGYLFLGYKIKKNKALLHNKSLIVLGIAAALCVIGTIFGEVNMAKDIWKLGVIDIVLSGIAGMLMMYIFSRVNSSLMVFQVVNWIGRHSLQIICIHTVESICIPWYLFAQLFSTNILMGISIQMILRGALIFICYFSLEKVIDVFNKGCRVLKINGDKNEGKNS